MNLFKPVDMKTVRDTLAGRVDETVHLAISIRARKYGKNYVHTTVKPV